MSSISGAQPIHFRIREVACPCALNCNQNRAWSRRLFTLLYPQACSLKRPAADSVHRIPYITAALAVLAFLGGLAAGQTQVSRWLLTLLSLAMGFWVLVLWRAGILPFSAAAAILLMQACSLTILISGSASSPELRVPWLGPFRHGLTMTNLVFWGSLPLRRTNERNRALILAKAVFLGIVAAQSIQQIKPVLGHSQLTLSELFGTATGFGLLCFAEKKRPEMPHGLFHPGYLTAI